MAAGSGHTCALTTAGGVKCWGSNLYGELGDGQACGRNFCSKPVDVSGLSKGVVSLTAGSDHTCALTSGDGVKCWGRNANGQLGNGSTIDSSKPVDVSGLTAGVGAISAAGASTCALTTAGGVKCWGDNAFAQLGNDTTKDSSTPVDVSGLTSGATAVAVGGYHACALTALGGVKCWGGNSDGQLGNGTRTGPQPCGAFSCSAAPVDVSLTESIFAIAAGGSGGHSYTCGTTGQGGVKCWGYNNSGELGSGASSGAQLQECAGFSCSSTPLDVSALASDVAALAAGPYHACALTKGGGVKCWGATNYGELGNGANTGVGGEIRAPVDVLGLTSGVAAVSAGEFHTCVLTTAGGVKCWGKNSSGELGNGTTTNSGTPVDVSGLTAGKR